MEDVMPSLVAAIMGEPCVLIFSSLSVWLVAMASGYVVVNKIECDDQDWLTMCRHLPDGVTYDPGDCDVVDDLELTFIPRAASSWRAVS